MLVLMGEPLDELQAALGVNLSAISGARAAAASERDKLGELLRDIGTTDAAIVAYGSLARGEWTAKSDVDWTLLVDGPAKPDQRATAHDIKRALTVAQVNAPNAAGAFGAMSFSSELVHRIGGDADTNRITTQRVLLLLESVPVRPQDAPVHERVVRAVLNSYLEHYEEGITRYNVPRFLLNDVVRYWRIMTVDAAAKIRDRGERGWQLRRLKLQTSRKLIFSAGLVMSLDAHIDSQAAPAAKIDLLESLAQHVSEAPLDRLARVAVKNEAMLKLARPVFQTYDQFLALIDHEPYRENLDTVDMKQAANDPTVAKARSIGRAFGEAIESFFFDSTSLYATAIRRYGVFRCWAFRLVHWQRATSALRSRCSRLTSSAPSSYRR